MFVTNENASVYGFIAQPRSARSQRWIAVLLSLIAPGLGHLYRGALGRAVVVFLITTIVGDVALMLVKELHGPVQLAILLPLVLVIAAVPALDANRFAAPASSSVAMYSRSRRYVYVGTVVLSMLIVQGVARKYLIAKWFQAFHTPSSSMQPLLFSGDYILARPIPSTLERGDIVVYREDGSSFVKRVVGVAGDTLSMDAGKLFLNGHQVAEPYATQKASSQTDSSFEWQRQYVLATVNRDLYKPSLGSWGPILVPDGRYFVLGDNRDNSMDSRYVGFIARGALRAWPTVIYFSLDPQTKRVRWSRIGNSAQ